VSANRMQLREGASQPGAAPRLAYSKVKELTAPFIVRILALSWEGARSEYRLPGTTTRRLELKFR
jgi:hypothetical protein